MDEMTRGERIRQTHIKIYGGIEGYKAEMQRRAKLRKVSKGGFYDNPELVQRAQEARRKNVGQHHP